METWSYTGHRMYSLGGALGASRGRRREASQGMLVQLLRTGASFTISQITENLPLESMVDWQRQSSAMSSAGEGAFFKLWQDSAGELEFTMGHVNAYRARPAWLAFFAACTDLVVLEKGAEINNPRPLLGRFW